ncbi:serine hydrolase domain-containing protein [Allostreptomyces psammosilenae]|uniref:CubicO group peptidase (Beta-lactamase class C family) n=1 Tax=Allostreptomyces psammosilenae TaxID=1892865 RepID=A0A853A188_9ACTN|nr:serine hydrolase domain-containing protein [Allostreptomyces psammosilenae]NYI04571.1 CubicO group peptidase (beta-lactamase class C family) [Allostreptomyces psammosilenae]
MRVEGFVAEGYEAVREVFQRLVDDGRETGAGVSVWREGREVVRLSGGWQDVGRLRPWRADTLVMPYSLSKTFVTLAALVAVRDGALSLDEPVATYWPEYGVRGKETTTLRQVLTHRAGQPRFPDAAAGLDLLDDEGLRASLVSAAPEYPPGTSLGEHALTYGHLVDGIVRAGAGTTLRELYHDVVRPALGLDAWFGVPDQELARVADLEYAHPDWPRRLHAAPWLRIPAGALDVGRTNSRPFRQALFGAVNLHTTATAMAAFFADLTGDDGPVRRLLGAELHDDLLASQVTDHDEVFGTRITWTLGFVRDRGKIAKGGIGGSAAWWSTRNRHGCAYLTRRLDDHSRAAEIAAALGDDLTVVGED